MRKGGERGLCGSRRLGIMYFIMISQQNCNLQRAMSYLLRARSLARFLHSSLFLFPFFLSFVLPYSPYLFHSPLYSPRFQGWIARRTVRRFLRNLRSKKRGLTLSMRVEQLSGRLLRAVHLLRSRPLFFHSTFSICSSIFSFLIVDVQNFLID